MAYEQKHTQFVPARLAKYTLNKLQLKQCALSQVAAQTNKTKVCFKKKGTEFRISTVKLDR